jgi:hypothetical protein
MIRLRDRFRKIYYADRARALRDPVRLNPASAL